LKQLKIRLFPDGQIQAETNGIKGEACTDYIKTLEKLLNAQTVESVFTKEYYAIQTEEASKGVVLHTQHIQQGISGGTV